MLDSHHHWLVDLPIGSYQEEMYMLDSYHHWLVDLPIGSYQEEMYMLDSYHHWQVDLAVEFPVCWCMQTWGRPTFFSG